MSAFSRIARSVPPLFKTPVRFKSTESEAAGATASKPASGYSLSYFLPNDPGVAFLMAVGLGAIGWLKADIMGIRVEMIEDRKKTDEGFKTIRAEISENVAALRSEMAQDRIKTDEGFKAIRSEMAQDRAQTAAGFAQVNSRLDQIFVLMAEAQKSKKALEKAESGGRSFCS
jgi:hypothetical protein